MTEKSPKNLKTPTRVEQKFTKKYPNQKESAEVAKIQAESIKLTNQLFSEDNFLNMQNLSKKIIETAEVHQILSGFVNIIKHAPPP